MEAIVSRPSSCLCLVFSSESMAEAISGASLTALGGGEGQPRAPAKQLGTATWKWTSLISAAGFQQLVLLWKQLEPPGPLALFLQGANAIPQLRFRNLPHRIRNRSSLRQGQGSPGCGPSSGASSAFLAALETEPLARGSGCLGFCQQALSWCWLTRNHHPNRPDFHFKEWVKFGCGEHVK